MKLSEAFAELVLAVKREGEGSFPRYVETPYTLEEINARNIRAAASEPSGAFWLVYVLAGLLTFAGMMWF